MPCPECGTQLVPKARFCHHCGWDSKLAAAGKASSTADHRPAWKRVSMAVTLGLASVFMLFLLLYPHKSAAEVTLAVGQQAPDFTVEAMDGSKVRLADLKGKPVVINFWASWCTPCRKEMPDFEAVYKQFAPSGLQLYGINVGESKVSISDFVNQVGATFPIAVDTDEEAQNAYKILPIPATFFIGADGKIKGIYQYQMSRSQIEAEVVRLLGNIER